MTEYGLPDIRDADGELQAVEYSYEWNGHELTIKFRPPTLSEQERLEGLDDDAGADELESLLNDHMVKPSVPEDSSWTAREMWAYVTGLIKWASGDDDDLAQEVQEEIDERSGGEGN